MKKLNLTEQKGIAQIFLLIGMLLVAISLPLATKLVQQNQENRSNAAATCKYNCTAWTTCNSSGKQTCKAQTKPQSGCTGGSSKIGTTQNCTPAKSAPVVTCTYNCTAWTTCTSGKQTCTAQTKPQSGCTGGSSKIGTTQNCTPAKSAPVVTKDCVCGTTAGTCTSGSPAWKDQYAAGGSYTWSCTGSNCNPKNCSAVKTSSPPSTTKTDGKCGAANGRTTSIAPLKADLCSYGATASTTDSSAADGDWNWTCPGSNGGNTVRCQAIKTGSGITPTPTKSVSSTNCVSMGGTCDVTCNYGVFTTATGCTGSTPYCCASKTTSTCATSGGFCTYDAAGCTTSKGKINDGMGCSGGQICCTGVNNGVKGNLYYFYNSGSCQMTSVYSSLKDCSVAKGVCYTSESSCKSARSCTILGGTCRTTCNSGETISGNGSGECSPAKCCTATSLCGIAASDNRDHYPVSNHCVAGAIYTKTDDVGKDGDYNWTCKIGGKAVECKAGTKKSGGGGGGGSDSGYYYTGFAVSPTTLKLKVGESATVTATESVTWSSDKADIAMVTADGIVTGVAVGTATVTATNASGATATVAVTVIASDARTLSFKVAFAGIKSYYTSGIGSTYNCLASLGDMTVEILNRPTNTYEKFTGVKVSVEGNELDSKENQVFRVSNLEVGSSLAGVNTFNYVKVKGPFHLKRRMCQDGQTGKLDETTTCDINLGKTDGVPYDFSEYTLLAGDVDSNGVINSVDFSLVKNAVNADAEPECGRQYDLNMDGVVNALDLNLVKDSLSSIDDE